MISGDLLRQFGDILVTSGDMSVTFRYMTVTLCDVSRKIRDIPVTLCDVSRHTRDILVKFCDTCAISKDLESDDHYIVPPTAEPPHGSRRWRRGQRAAESLCELRRASVIFGDLR